MKTKIIAFLLALCMTAWFNSCDLDSKVYSSVFGNELSENGRGCALYVDWVVCLF